MWRKMVVLFTAVVALLALMACQPSGSEVGVTPETTLPAAPTVESTATVATPASPEAATATAEPATATIAATTAPAATLDAFIAQLQAAIDNRDAAAIQALMADPFTIGYWLSEGVEMSAGEAALQVVDLSPADGALRWAPADLDLAPLLMGQPPATFLGPDKQVAATVLSAGWGEDGAGEAVHFITQGSDGTYRWELMLYSGFGLAAPTDVASVLINGDEATFYSGPGTSYEPVATVFGGQSYPVLGVSDDGAWWRLLCYGDANEWIASCWVSADPAVTTPAMP